MKKIIFALFVFNAFLTFAQKITYNSKNVELLSVWDDPSITPNGTFVNSRFSSCWGYAQNGREYAVVGAQNGTYIIDITVAAAPKKVAFVKGARNNCIWREYKTYKNYLYCISDDSSPNSFQIVDMSYLPDSVKVVHDGTSIFEKGHTIWVDKDKMYIASTKFKSGTAPMSIFDLANPAQPKLIRNVDQDSLGLSSAHDMFVKNDTCYYSGGYSGLQVLQFTSDNKFKLLGSYSNYPQGGYNHASMLLPNPKYLLMTDEVPSSLPCKIIDVSDLKDIKPVSTFTSGSNATPHNLFPAPNNRAVITYYEDGVQIFDLSNPLKPVKTGFFDTHYQTDSTNTQGQYKGAWSAYTTLPSKNMIVVDMQNGLFVLDAKKAYGTNVGIQDIINQSFATIYPNPAQDNFTITSSETALFELSLYDINGKILFNEKNKNIAHSTINVQNLQTGIYFLKIANPSKVQVEKIIKN